MKTIQFFLLGILLSVYVTSCSSDEQGIEKEEGFNISIQKVKEEGEARTPLTINPLGNLYEIGDQILISWYGLLCFCDWSASHINIDLYVLDDSSGSFVYDSEIVSNFDSYSNISEASARGSYIWEIPNDISSGEYCFRMYDSSKTELEIITDGGETYSESFEIIGTTIELPSDFEAITFPNDGYQTAYFTRVKWDKSQFSGNVNIKIYVDGNLETTKINYKNIGEYGLDISDGYDGKIKFVLIDSQDNSRYDEVVFDLYDD